MSDHGHRRGSERRPVALQVRLAYDDLGEFVDRYALNISDGGIFIRSREPRPVGSKLKFELHLRTGEVVFAGEGTVRWRQLPDARGLGLSGMGLQFDNLTDESRRVLNDILRAREEERIPPPVQGASPAAWEPLQAFPVPEPTPEETVPAPVGPPVLKPTVTQTARAVPAAAVPSGKMPIARIRPVAQEAMLGIDFGWGSIRAAAANGEKATLIPLAARGGLPAVVAFDDGRLLFGDAARQAMLRGAPGVRGITQILGRRREADGADTWRKRQMAEPVVAPDGRLGVSLGGQVHPVQTLARHLLEEARTRAEVHLQRPVSRAAFAVPNSWSDAQRHALRAAAVAAGLEVTHLVSAPPAAMLAVHGPEGKRRSLIVHFGEGALEAAVVEQSGHVFDLMTAIGDSALGGADIDVQLVASVLAQFEQETGLLVPENPAVFERAREAASRCKEILSDLLESEIVLDRLVDAGLSKADLRQNVSRARFVTLIAPILEKAADLVQTAMTSRGLRPGDVDEVLLFGAQARLTPFVRRIAEKVGREPAIPESSIDAAAIGAALMADGGNTLGRYVMAGAVGGSVGIGLPGGGIKRLIERNLPLPVERGYTIATSVSGQREIELHLFQGERPEAFENEYVGSVIIGPLPSAPKGEVRITVTLVVDTSGEISVRAREVAGGKPVQVLLNRARPLDSARKALIPGSA